MDGYQPVFDSSRRPTRLHMRRATSPASVGKFREAIEEVAALTCGRAQRPCRHRDQFCHPVAGGE